jgi:hypothetical protein
MKKLQPGLVPFLIIDCLICLSIIFVVLAKG